MPDEFFEEMNRLEQQRGLQCQQAYHQLVRDLVNNKKGMTPAVALDIRVAAGKTQADLEQAKAAYAARVNAAVVIKEEKAVTDQLLAVEAAVAEETRKLNAASAAYRAAIVPLIGENATSGKRGELHARMSAIAAAKKLLQDQCDDPALLAERNEIDNRSADLTAEFNQLTATVHHAGMAAERLKELAEIQGHTAQELTEIANCKEAVKGAPAAQAALKKNRIEFNETLPKRRAALIARMLSP